MADLDAAQLAIAGTLLGIVVGALLKLLSDIATETGRRKRDAEAWRRQHVLDSASEMLAQSGKVHVLTRTIRDEVENLTASRQAGHQDAYRASDARLRDYSKRKEEALDAADDALRRLSLLLPQEAYLAASKYLEAVTTKPDDPNTTLLGIVLNDLLRKDLAIQPRKIPRKSRITGEQYVQKVKDLRQSEAPR